MMGHGLVGSNDMSKLGEMLLILDSCFAEGDAHPGAGATPGQLGLAGGENASSVSTKMSDPVTTPGVIPDGGWALMQPC